MLASVGNKYTHAGIKAEPAKKSNRGAATSRPGLSLGKLRVSLGGRIHAGMTPEPGERTMAKGQMRSNKEAKKPKKDKVAAAKPITGLGSGSAGNAAKK